MSDERAVEVTETEACPDVSGPRYPAWVRTPDEIKQAKFKAAVKRHSERTERQVRRAQYRRCFWTRPFGHAWEEDGYYKVCVACTKRVLLPWLPLGSGRSRCLIHEPEDRQAVVGSDDLAASLPTQPRGSR